MTCLRCAPALVACVCACQPLVFPRTAELAKRGEVSLQGSVQVVTLEPQEVIETSGKRESSTVGFVPDLELEGHVGLGRCETGVVLEDFAALAELRCALLEQARGAPLSVAFSGAAGASASAGIAFAPAARLGLDVSRRFGSFEPLVDLYLTTQRQAHYVQTGVVDDPVVGPAGVILGREELRLSIPIGFAWLAPDKAHRPLDPAFRSFLVGVTPWFVLAASSHVEVDPVPRSYAIAGWGMSLTIAMAFR